MDTGAWQATVSPWSLQESDTTSRLKHYHHHLLILLSWVLVIFVVL